MFFVLSGFLISSLLFKEYLRCGAIDYRRFLIRRGFKIYPAFWVLLIFSAIVGPLGNDSKWPTWRQWVGELLFLQNYVGQILPHTWSLAVEEHFYLGIAALFAIFSTRPNHQFRFVPAVFFTVAAMCMVLRLATWYFVPGYSHRAYLYGTHIRIDSLMFGVLLSYLVHFRNLESRLSVVPSWLLLLLGILLLMPAYVFELSNFRWIPVFGVVLFYIGSGCILLASIRLAYSKNKVLHVLATCGAASYSIYIWHMTVNLITQTRLINPSLGLGAFYQYVIVYVLLSVIVGVILNKLIEIPILKLREAAIPATKPSMTVQKRR